MAQIDLQNNAKVIVQPAIFKLDKKETRCKNAIEHKFRVS